MSGCIVSPPPVPMGLMASTGALAALGCEALRERLPCCGGAWLEAARSGDVGWARLREALLRRIRMLGRREFVGRAGGRFSEGVELGRRLMAKVEGRGDGWGRGAWPMRVK